MVFLQERDAPARLTPADPWGAPPSGGRPQLTTRSRGLALPDLLGRHFPHSFTPQVAQTLT